MLSVAMKIRAEMPARKMSKCKKELRRQAERTFTERVLLVGKFIIYWEWVSITNEIDELAFF